MGQIRKTVPPKDNKIKKATSTDVVMTFSFKFFDEKDEDVCPASFHETYTQALMLRLRVLSSWPGEKFRGKMENNIRNHRIAWEDTARAGFSRVSAEHKDTQAWQFAVEEHKHGRVHGFFIGDTFYIIWLDSCHALYPSESGTTKGEGK